MAAIEMLEATYNPVGEINIAIEERRFDPESIEKYGLPSEPYAALTIGALRIFPEAHHVEKLAAALNAYLAAKHRCVCGHPDSSHRGGKCHGVLSINGTRSAECPCLGFVGGGNAQA